MKSKIPDPLLSRLSGFITKRMGLYFPPERWADLERAIVSAAKEFGSKNSECFLHGLLSPSPKRDQIEILVHSLTVGESYFFRDKKSFEVLERSILPQWLQSRRNQEQRLRIWSAGCAGGEEAYSIAIMLSRIIPGLSDWDISILATDINPRFLQKAAEGVYTEWSFRNEPRGTKEVYFRKIRGGRYRISPQIKAMVTFSPHNLAADPYPSVLNHTTGMDLIFCRNVIMYFAEEAQKKVIRNLYHCLVEGGCLLVSPTEISPALFSEYVALAFPGVTIYRKSSGKDPKRVHLAAENIQTIPGDQDTSRSDGGVNLETEPYPAETGTAKSAAPPVEEPSLFYDPVQEARLDKKNQARSSDRQDWKSLELLSRAKANEGKLGEALDWCEKGIALDKLNPGAHYLRATILQEQGKLEETILSLKKCLYLDPDFVLAHFALGNLFRRQGKRKESERHFGNALGLVKGLRKEELIGESEGISAGGLIEIIKSIMSEETQA